MRSSTGLAPHFLVATLFIATAASAVPAPAPSASAADSGPALSSEVAEAKSKANALRDGAAQARARVEELVLTRTRLSSTFKAAQADASKHRTAGLTAYSTYTASLRKPAPASLRLTVLHTANTELEAQLVQAKLAIDQGEALRSNDVALGAAIISLADVKRSADTATKDANAALQKLDTRAHSITAQAKQEKSAEAQRRATEAQADATRAKADQQATAVAAASATKDSAKSTNLANLGAPEAVTAQRARATAALQKLRTERADSEQKLKELRVALNSPCDIRKVDWQNATLTCRALNVRFKDGENHDHDGYSVDSVEYGDLDGDGLVEAFVKVVHYSYGQSLGDSVVIAYHYDAECTIHMLGVSAYRYTTAQASITPPKLTISGEEPSGCNQAQGYVLKSNILTKISDTGCKNE